MRLCILLSGGKDSLFAWYRAQMTDQVVCSVSIVSANAESYMFHTPNSTLAAMQAEAAGIPCIIQETKGIKEKELDDLTAALKNAIEWYNVEGVVTGAILSVYQATRIQKICNELGIWCFNPLWQIDQEAYLHELIRLGFSVYITGVFGYPLDEKWLGRELDIYLLKALITCAQRYRITLCGEGGEYETFVTDAPFFKKRIVIKSADMTYHNYHGIYQITRACLEEKDRCYR
ncbi:MAG: diphthine--ammonia ligase [Methanospirillaceae archaeon]|nr:diphthine--ammonia ligase [Methanospirillaceae archaeon]